jgi:Mn2+/Fe2+ NRAMP family transporter
MGRFWKLLGPGILLAAAAVGASHLVISPTAGAAFGYQLLWLVPLACALRYHAFEFGPRFAIATGTSLLEGYSRVPGPRHWAVILFLLGTVLQGVGVVSAVVGVAAAVLYAGLGVGSLPLWGTVVATAIVALLFLGRYRAMDVLNKVMMVVLALATLVAFAASPPPLSAFRHLVMPAIPVGSIALVAALIGWMPAGIDVSVWHSLWALRDRKRWNGSGEGRSVPARGDALRRALTDMRTGYGFTVVLGIVFLMLGARILHPQGLMPRGADVAVTLSRVYTDILGNWMYPVFLAAAFFAMFSTSYTVMDGFPRAYAETVRVLRGRERNVVLERNSAYWGFLLFVYLLALVFLVLIPRPVMLVTGVAALSLVLSPFYCWFNYHCVTRQIPEAEFRPRRPDRVIAILGIVFNALAAGLYLYVEVWGKL